MALECGVCRREETPPGLGVTESQSCFPGTAKRQNALGMWLISRWHKQQPARWCQIWGASVCVHGSSVPLSGSVPLLPDCLLCYPLGYPTHSPMLLFFAGGLPPWGSQLSLVESP